MICSIAIKSIGNLIALFATYKVITITHYSLLITNFNEHEKYIGRPPRIESGD